MPYFSPMLSSWSLPSFHSVAYSSIHDVFLRRRGKGAVGATQGTSFAEPALKGNGHVPLAPSFSIYIVIPSVYRSPCKNEKWDHAAHTLHSPWPSTSRLCIVYCSMCLVAVVNYRRSLEHLGRCMPSCRQTRLDACVTHLIPLFIFSLLKGTPPKFKVRSLRFDPHERTRRSFPVRDRTCSWQRILP